MIRIICLVLLLCGNAYAGIDFSMLSYPQQTTLSTGVIVSHNGVTITENQHMNASGDHTSPMKEGWSIIDTSLADVETALNIKLIEAILDLKERYPDKEIVVIDWGCGRGRAINELARQARGLDGVKFIGFSNLYFPMWSRTHGVEYIFDEMENLHKYFNGEQIGIIFSYFGLFHLTEDKMLSHLNIMANSIVEGGVIVTNFNHYKQGELLDLSFKYRMKEGFTDFDRVKYLIKKHTVGASIRMGSIPIEQGGKK